MSIHFFYATGTSYVVNLFERALSIAIQSGPDPKIVEGLNGFTALWDGLIPNDPFPSLLNQQAWTTVKIGYPASAFPMLNSPLGLPGSINVGRDKMLAAINALPSGTPYCLGGYSQGAAVCTFTLQALRAANSPKLADLKGAVMFGNPCRETDKTWPAFGGLAGGQFSGRFDVPNSTTGGHGCFPSAYRLTSTPETWFEFVGSRTHNIDIINSVGDQTNGTNVQAAANDLLTLGLGALPAVIFNSAKTTALQAWSAFGDGGHVGYPFEPPPGYGENDPTSFQIALRYLESIAAQYSTAPILLPSQPTTTASAGWSTTLVPPAA